MPNIHSSLVHLPGYKPPKPPKFGRARPYMNRAKNKAKSMYGNATSRKAVNQETGQRMGRVHPTESTGDDFADVIRDVEQKGVRANSKYVAAVGGLTAGGYAGGAYGRKKYLVKKARAYQITEVGTKAVQRYPWKPKKTFAVATGVGFGLGVQDAKVQHLQHQRAAKAAATRKKNKMAQLTQVSKSGSDNGHKYSTGRAVAATTLGHWHGLATAKQGKKLRTAGRSLGESMVGGTVGGTLGGLAGLATKKPALAQAGNSLGGAAGAYGGSYHAFRANNKKGYYRRQTVKKNLNVSAFGIEH